MRTASSRLLFIGTAGVAGLLALVAALPTAGQETGNSSTMLYLRSTGETNFAGKQIKYILALTYRPSSGQPAQSGSLLAFLPPVDVYRDPKTGEPAVEISDPDLGGDVYLPSHGGRACTAREFAEAVRKGEVKPDRNVLVTMTIEFYHHPLLKKAVLSAARMQLREKAEDVQPTSTVLLDTDEARLERSVIMLPAREVRILCQTPGFATVVLPLPGRNPMLGDKLTVQAEVPARFINQFYSKGGLNLQAEFTIDVFAESVTTLQAQQIADDFVDLVAKEHGKGGFHADGKNIEILVTRDSLLNLQRSAKWKERLIVRGADNDTINVLLGLFQRRDLDLFATTEKQIEDLVRAAVDKSKILSDPSIATALSAINRKETDQVKVDETFRSVIDTLNRRTASAGGGSFLGLFSSANSNSNEEARGHASKEQQFRLQKDFLSALHSFQTTGQFKVPPTVALNIVSKQTIQRIVETELSLNVSGKVRPMALSADFNSRVPTLRPEQLARERALDAARSLEEKARRTTSDLAGRR